MTFWADGPRRDGGENVSGRAHAAENGNPHSPEEAGREGDEPRTAQSDSVASANVSMQNFRWSLF